MPEMKTEPDEVLSATDVRLKNIERLIRRTREGTRGRQILEELYDQTVKMANIKPYGVQDSRAA